MPLRTADARNLSLTLLEMAAYKPRSLGHLAAISGVGPTKLARYGEAFLAVLSNAGS